MRFLAVVLWTLIFAPVAFGESVDEATGLIVAPGWEQVRAHCGGCHSHKLVTSQRADRQTWLDIIRWMQETQNVGTVNVVLEYRDCLIDLGIDNGCRISARDGWRE